MLLPSKSAGHITGRMTFDKIDNMTYGVGTGITGRDTGMVLISMQIPPAARGAPLSAQVSRPGMAAT